MMQKFRGSVLKRKLYILRYYLSIFFFTLRKEGVKAAIKKSLDKLFPSRKLKKISDHEPFVKSDYLPIVKEGLSKDLDFIVIITDTMIDQCLTYRVNQKIFFLESVGFSTIKLSSSQIGKILSFASLAKKVIVYRTALSGDIIKSMQDEQVKLYFEFDDLVVGKDMLFYSGIKASLSEKQIINIEKESSELEETAFLCDELIVSTDKLRKVYSENSTKLKNKKIHTINNFLVNEEFKSPASKSYDFAFTTPSLSISNELEMVKDFLGAIDEELALSGGRKKVLVIGNEKAYSVVEKCGFENIDLTFIKYLEYGSYLKTLEDVSFVMIPLSDLNFNQSKTAIRAYDALLAGAVPLVSPVGEYANFVENEALSKLVINGDDWAMAAKAIVEMRNGYYEVLASAQSAIKEMYGWSAAKSEYKRFLNEDS
ncbi:MAG: hypothetical protein U9Q35_15580 [Pseudomonadota bacterium]|nr:hypothetical protein [Pseudomonadota bacterium]